ncbi:MAG: hypothetical protein HQ592_10820 [Planctomycetes bacterium]|nr:hypothetical protein [Planctomycetota bacterium]
MKLKLLITAALVAVALVAAAPPAAAEGNIIRNGKFEQGPGDEYGPPYWNTGIMGFMPKIVGKDDNGDNIYNYICGCGHNMGPTKPEVGVRCEKCRRYSIAEETGGWYNDNHNLVKLGPGKGSGYGIKMTLPKAIGENQGTRCVSDIVHVRRDWPYELSLDVRTKGAVVRVWAEGYRYADVARDSTKDDVDAEEENKDVKDDDNDDDALQSTQSMTRVIEKCYRAQINFGSPGGWTRKSRIFMPPERYKVDFFQVKLYAYMPGEAYFDNVVLRPLSSYEANKWMSTRKKKKDKRFQ